MSSEATQLGEVTNARELLDALQRVEGLYATLREDVEAVNEILYGLDLDQSVTTFLDSVAEHLHAAENAISDAQTAFDSEHGALLELVESGKTIPGLGPFFADCAG